MEGLAREPRETNRPMLRLLLLLIVIFSTPAFAEGAAFEDAFSPHQGATALVVRTINAARTSIHVAAYEFTSRPIAAALVAAHDRGVDVDVVVDKSQRKSKATKIWLLKASGIPIRINDRYHIMHDKFMVIDAAVLELGSFNYTSAAENANAENVLVIHGSPRIVEDYDRQWRRLWDEARQD